MNHKITLEEEGRLVKEYYRRVPPRLYDEVWKHLQEIIGVGTRRPSNSPWASAVVLLRKKNGKLHFCIDLQKLNSLTVKDAYRIPKIQDTLDCLQGAVWFTLLDIKIGYCQVELEDASKAVPAFTVGPLGFYECEQMPFGLKNTLATFQCLMETSFGDLQFQWCIIYLDDVIFARTPREHLRRLCTVLSWLWKLD